MRRNEREITKRAAIDRVIEQALVCRLGMARDNRPYLVPVSFGYDGQSIYFHTAREGMKIDYLTTNPQVCFELEGEVALISNNEAACQWSFAYTSVIGFGEVVEISQPDEKITALNHIMRHYSGRAWDFKPNSLAKTRLWRVIINHLTGKQSPVKKKE